MNKELPLLTQSEEQEHQLFYMSKETALIYGLLFPEMLWHDSKRNQVPDMLT